jgi:hypothetical protein
MAFYTEFTNLTTGLEVAGMAEFVSAPTETRFKRKNGVVYSKNAQGYLEVYTTDTAAESIDSTKFKNVQSIQILDSAGGVVKTIYGAGE